MISCEYVGLMSGCKTKNGEPFVDPGSILDGRELFKEGDILDYGHSAYRVTFVDKYTLKTIRIR